MSARYSRQSGYTIARRATKPTSRTVQRRVKFGPTTAKYIGLAVLGILALVMVTRVTTTSTDVYNQNKIRTETSKANAEVDTLRLEARREQAISRIKPSPDPGTLQTADKVEYVSVGDVERGTVAGVSTTKP